MQIFHHGKEPMTLRQVLSHNNRVGKRVQMLDVNGNLLDVFVITLLDDKIQSEFLDRKYYKLSVIHEGPETLVLKVQENY